MQSEIKRVRNIMYVDTVKKKEIFKEFGGADTNSGSAESQVALFTARINHLTNHLKENRKDFVTQRSLIKMVGKRRKMLKYIRNNDIVKYRELISQLGIRDTFK